MKEEFAHLSDEEVFVKALSDPSFFELIVERYEEAFLRKARTILRNDEVAKDVVQDTFVKIYLYGKNYKPQEGARWSSWAYKILINTCFVYHKKAKRDTEFSTSFDDELEAVIPDESTHNASKLDTDYVMSLVDKMPETFAKILRLYVVEGKNYEEIAKAEGITMGAVKTRMHRAKGLLKKLSTENKY